jgi:hypothetical protein
MVLEPSELGGTTDKAVRYGQTLHTEWHDMLALNYGDISTAEKSDIEPLSMLLRTRLKLLPYRIGILDHRNDNVANM